MRLLNTDKLEFEEFLDSEIPRYTILSHRWGNKEVAFHEFEDAKKERGHRFSKIENFCCLAQNRGYKYAWIDTCCIDKRSSAELSEAINSMFRWYASAWECYAYLSDVEWVQNDGSWEKARAQVCASTWFTRGWTLQELLAPYKLIFLDRHWLTIGTKDALSAEISAITGIERQYLDNPYSIDQASVAIKMSWVSKRETSRVEDMAYSLMGILGVNMPLLYGEGKRGVHETSAGGH